MMAEQRARTVLLFTSIASPSSCKKNQDCFKLCLPPTGNVTDPQDPGEEEWPGELAHRLAGWLPDSLACPLPSPVSAATSY